MRKLLLMAFLSVIFISGCTEKLVSAGEKDIIMGDEKIIDMNNQKGSGFCGRSTKFSCNMDNECRTAGCSMQVCQGNAEEEMMTTCEYRDCYDADAYDVRCGCFSGLCQWG